MTRIKELPFLNIITLGGDAFFISYLKTAAETLHNDVNIATVTSVAEVKQHLKRTTCTVLVIDQEIAGSDIRPLISFCKKKYRDTIIMITGTTAEMPLLMDLFKAGINTYLSTDVTSYELKVALLKNLSGENYVSTTISGKLAASKLAHK